MTALGPYRILFSRRSWYVIGRSSIHRAVRTFNLGRILHAELIGAHYVIPQRFNIDRYLGNAWHLIRAKNRHQVVIRFQKQVADNVAEVRWHKTQTTHRNADGTIEFRAVVDGLSEIIWWVLGYGDQAEVLEPPQLREMVAVHVAALAKVYQRRPSEKRSAAKLKVPSRRGRQSKAAARVNQP